MKAHSPRTQPLVIGVGSPHGDDVAGWEAVSLLRELHPTQAEYHKAAVPHDLIDWIIPDRPLHLIDGLHAEIEHWQCHQITNLTSDTTPFITNLASASSHQIDLLAVLKLAESLQRLPAQLWLWTIPIRETRAGFPMRLETRQLVQQLAEALGRHLIHA